MLSLIIKAEAASPVRLVRPRPDHFSNAGAASVRCGKSGIILNIYRYCGPILALAA